MIIIIKNNQKIFQGGYMLKRFLAAGLALILALGPASQALAVEPGQNEAKRIEASIENPVDNKSMGEKDRDDKKVSEKKVYIVDLSLIHI